MVSSSLRFVLATLFVAFISGVVLPQMPVQAAGGPAGTGSSSGAAGYRQLKRGSRLGRGQQLRRLKQLGWFKQLWRLG